MMGLVGGIVNRRVVRPVDSLGQAAEVGPWNRLCGLIHAVAARGQQLGARFLNQRRHRGVFGHG
jgi:hypothetical protein